MDWTARRSGAGTGTDNGAPKGGPTPTPGQSTLWQDLPAVREAGVLEQLTPEQCKYQEVRERLMYLALMLGKEKWEMQYHNLNCILKS